MAKITIGSAPITPAALIEAQSVLIRPITVEILDEEFAGSEPLLVLLGLYGTVQYAIARSASSAASAGTADP